MRLIMALAASYCLLGLSGCAVATRLGDTPLAKHLLIGVNHSGCSRDHVTARTLQSIAHVCDRSFTVGWRGNLR